MIRSKYTRVQSRMYRRPLVVDDKKVGTVTINMDNHDICMTVDNDDIYKKYGSTMLDHLAFTIIPKDGAE